MSRTVICVSHETGAGGTDVARAVATRLGYRYVDEDVLVRAAGTAGITVSDLADVERRKSFFARILDDLGRSPVAPHDAYGVASALLPSLPSPDELRAEIRKSIAEFAEEGEVVIVAHAASHALGARENVLRVWVVASREVRVARIAAEHDVDERAATHEIDENDRARADYLKRTYGVKGESPTAYDLVVNTTQIDPATLADVVCSLAER